MKKLLTLMSLISFVLVVSSGLIFGQDVDITGTWVGETMVPDDPEPDQLTLVIKKDDGEYTATASDSFEMFKEVECGDFELDDNKLTFNISFEQDYETVTVYLILTVDGDTMTGHWETEDGNSAPIELEKK